MLNPAHKTTRDVVLTRKIKQFLRSLGACLFAAFFAVGAAFALDIPLPETAQQTSSRSEEFASYDLPIGPYDLGEIQTIIAEGALVETTWSLPIAGQTTLALMDQLRQSIESQGFELLYECETAECGGFDFRFSTRLVPEPAMRIDLGDFRFLSSQRLGSSIPEYLSIFVSRGFQTAFVQMIHVGPGGTQEGEQTNRSTESLGVNETSKSVGELLTTTGHAVLSDLQFETGSSELGSGRFESLVGLAEFLNSNSGAKVLLVGHTDTSGSLSANVLVSQRRAASVVERLVSEHGVAAEQLDAAGAGYLAPIASNQKEDGRRKNRRVEVVLTSTLE